MYILLQKKNILERLLNNIFNEILSFNVEHRYSRNKNSLIILYMYMYIFVGMTQRSQSQLK